jgi:hypothetical protein
VAATGGNLWAVNGIESVDPHGVEGVRYLALFKRYEKERERAVLQKSRRGAQPVFTALHRRPNKLLEIEFLQRNPMLNALQVLPSIGGFIANMRDEALKMNRLHFIEVYDLDCGNGARDGVSDRKRSIGPTEEMKRLG